MDIIDTQFQNLAQEGKSININSCEGQFGNNAHQLLQFIYLQIMCRKIQKIVTHLNFSE